MRGKSYNNEIVKAIKNYLSEKHLAYQFEEFFGKFFFNFPIKGRITLSRCVIDVSDDSYEVHIIYPVDVIKINEQEMNAVTTFLVRVNYEKDLGNCYFQPDVRDGELRCTAFVDCTDRTISQKLVEKSILGPATAFENYGSGILWIMFGNRSVEEALEKCDREKRERNEMELQRRVLMAEQRKQIEHLQRLTGITLEDSDEKEDDDETEHETTNHPDNNRDFYSALSDFIPDVVNSTTEVVSGMFGED